MPNRAELAGAVSGGFQCCDFFFGMAGLRSKRVEDDLGDDWHGDQKDSRDEVADQAERVFQSRVHGVVSFFQMTDLQGGDMTCYRFTQKKPDRLGPIKPIRRSGFLDSSQ